MLVNVYLYSYPVVSSLCCSMEPAIESKIPIYIRNTFEPKLAGTRIYLPTKVSCSTELPVLGVCVTAVR